MGGHTASYGQDALSCLHTGNVFGRSFKTYQYNLFASCLPALRVLGGEYDLAAGSSGGSAQALSDGSGSLKRLCVELRVKKRVKVAGIYHKNGFLFGSHAFVNKIAGNLQRRLSGSLAITGLEHIKLAVFNGELHILHVSVMIFKGGANINKLLEGFGELLLHFVDVHGCANTSNNVLALSVGKEFAEEPFSAGGGVAGEGNAGAAVIAHIAEGHGLNVYGSAP